MRPALNGLTLLTGLGVVVAACGQDPSSAATGSGSSASGTGGAPYCADVHLDSVDTTDIYPCNICLHEKCCTEIAGCNDKACVSCANFYEVGCSDLSVRARKCAVDRCKPTCLPGFSQSAGGAGGATSSSSG